MWTLNNPTKADRIRLKQLVRTEDNTSTHITYIVFQEEKAPITGTIHFQGYIEFNCSMRTTRIKNVIFNRSVHLSRVDYPHKAIAYCKKSDTKVIDGQTGEWGTAKAIKTWNGKLLDAINDGAKTEELIQSFPEQFIKHGPNILKMKNLLIKPRRHAMEILIYYGKTGCGKSFTANEKYTDAYWSKWPCGGRWWWDGYDGEETVIMDEFRHQISFDQMLNIIDCYPYKTEYKGGMREFTSKRIVITTNIDPMNWYPNLEDVSMLHRRFRDFAKIFDFNDLDMEDDGSTDLSNISFTERTTVFPRTVFRTAD